MSFVVSTRCVKPSWGYVRPLTSGKVPERPRFLGRPHCTRARCLADVTYEYAHAHKLSAIVKQPCTADGSDLMV
jgi:hypothetical protein